MTDRVLAKDPPAKKYSWSVGDPYKDTSTTYQWIPSEVKVSKEGHVKFDR